MTLALQKSFGRETERTVMRMEHERWRSLCMQLVLFGLNKTARPHPISILVEKRDAAVYVPQRVAKDAIREMFQMGRKTWHFALNDFWYSLVIKNKILRDFCWEN